MHHKVKHVRLECFWASWKVHNKAVPTILSEGQMEEWKALKFSVKVPHVPNWAQRSQESTWDIGGGNGRWGRKASDECEMCTENDKGSGWERQSQ
jgi:hypothetical protein